MSGYSFGDFWFDIENNEVSQAKQTLHLTPTEKTLLRLLLQARSAAVTEDEIADVVWHRRNTNVDVKRNLAVLKSSVNTKFKREVIVRTDTGGYHLIVPVVYRADIDAPRLDTHPEIAKFLSETRYGISPIDGYLPIYPAYRGLTRDEIEYEYQGEYEPPEDFLKLMKRYPPEPPINQLYSFHGWEGEIPSEDELAGKEGKQLVLYLQGGSWHQIHTLNQIWKACNMTPPDQECLEFRANHLKTLIPLSSSSLYHNANTEVIVVTADDQIVIARRKGAIVFEGSWTASLEEQMLRHREKDGLSDEMDLFACAERGARGELGITVISEHTRLLSVGIEFGNFTAAFLFLIRSAETFGEIATKTWPNASECDEAVALDALPARPAAIKEILKADQYCPGRETCMASPRWNSPGDPRTPGPWHPVAKARLDAYLRHIVTTGAVQTR
jgi:DNA-binding winged helix-turn-helix (wHTH) protein